MKIGIYTEIYKPVLNGVVVSVESFRQQMNALGNLLEQRFLAEIAW